MTTLATVPTVVAVMLLASVALSSGEGCKSAELLNMVFVGDDLPNGLVKNIETQQECCALCAKRNDCTHYTWHSELNRSKAKQCLLKKGQGQLQVRKTGITVSGIMPAKPPPTPRPPPPPYEAKRCEQRLIQNMYYDNDDLPDGTVKNVRTYQECCGLCAVRKGCTHYSHFNHDWIKAPNTCVLKTNTKRSRLRTGRNPRGESRAPAVTSQTLGWPTRGWKPPPTKPPPPTPAPKSTCGLAMIKDMAIDGDDLPSGQIPNVNSAAACCALCGKRDGCRYYTWYNGNNRGGLRNKCTLKKNYGKMTAKLRMAVSGVMPNPPRLKYNRKGERPCGELTVKNGVTIPKGTEHNAAVKIKCKPSTPSLSYVADHSTLTCKDGTFDPAAAVCAEKKLTPPCAALTVKNGVDIPAGTKDGVEVTITCNSGLYTHYPTIKCANSKWDKPGVACGEYGGPKTVFYHGHYFKVIPNRPSNFVSAKHFCNQHGGIIATVLSAHMLTDVVKKIIPYSQKGIQPQTGVALRQPAGKPTRGTPARLHNWEWWDSGTGKAVKLDDGNTVLPVWGGPNAPKGRRWDEDGETYHAMIMYVWQVYGLNDFRGYGGPWMPALCQMQYPFYQFTAVKPGHRMTFPLESQVNAATLAECNTSCNNDAFCRTISYSASLKKCLHHSIPPTEPTAKVVADPAYTVYA